MRPLAWVLSAFLAGAALAAEDQTLSTVIDGVEIALLLPGGVKVFRGAVVNPADKEIVRNGPWVETFRNLDMAVMGLLIDRKRNNRPTILRQAMLKAWQDFGRQTGHPEFEHMPLCFGGFSAGGGWSATIAQALPERAVGYHDVCCWIPDSGKPQCLKQPAMLIIGSVPDDFKMLEAIPAKYDPARRSGALWTLALAWGCAHDYGNANALGMPFLDAVVRARVPADAAADKGPVQLNELKEEDGWLGDRGTWETNLATIAPWAEYKGDKAAATWLPNRYLAYTWRAFVSQDAPVVLNAVTADGRMKLPECGEKVKRAMITDHGTEVVLDAAPRTGTDLKRAVFYDGDVELGAAAQAPWKLSWKGAVSGPHAVYAQYELTDGRVGVSSPGLIVVKRQ